LYRGATSTVGGVEITVLYFDGCPNWQVAAQRLAVIAAEHPGVTVTTRLIETPEEAEALCFRGSPSIVLAGTDLFPDPSTAVGLACRRYLTPDGLAGAPTLDQLRAALRSVSVQTSPVSAESPRP
jgi:hypothetical protein